MSALVTAVVFALFVGVASGSPWWAGAALWGACIAYQVGKSE